MDEPPNVDDSALEGASDNKAQAGATMPLENESDMSSGNKNNVEGVKPKPPKDGGGKNEAEDENQEVSENGIEEKGAPPSAGVRLIGPSKRGPVTAFAGRPMMSRPQPRPGPMFRNSNPRSKLLPRPAPPFPAPSQTSLKPPPERNGASGTDNRFSRPGMRKLPPGLGGPSRGPVKEGAASPQEEPGRKAEISSADAELNSDKLEEHKASPSASKEKTESPVSQKKESREEKNRDNSNLDKPSVTPPRSLPAASRNKLPPPMAGGRAMPPQGAGGSIARPKPSLRGSSKQKLPGLRLPPARSLEASREIMEGNQGSEKSTKRTESSSEGALMPVRGAIPKREPQGGGGGGPPSRTDDGDKKGKEDATGLRSAPPARPSIGTGLVASSSNSKTKPKPFANGARIPPRVMGAGMKPLPGTAGSHVPAPGMSPRERQMSTTPPGFKPQSGNVAGNTDDEKTPGKVMSPQRQGPKGSGKAGYHDIKSLSAGLPFLETAKYDSLQIGGEFLEHTGKYKLADPSERKRMMIPLPPSASGRCGCGSQGEGEGDLIHWKAQIPFFGGVGLRSGRIALAGGGGMAGMGVGSGIKIYDVMPDCALVPFAEFDSNDKLVNCITEHPCGSELAVSMEGSVYAFLLDGTGNSFEPIDCWTVIPPKNTSTDGTTAAGATPKGNTNDDDEDDVDQVTVLEFNLAGDLIATGGEDNKVRVWHYHTKQMLALYDLSNAGNDITSVAFMPDSKTAIACDKSKVAYVLSIAEEKVIHRIDLPQQTPNALFRHFRVVRVMQMDESEGKVRERQFGIATLVEPERNGWSYVAKYDISDGFKIVGLVKVIQEKITACTISSDGTSIGLSTSQGSVLVVNSLTMVRQRIARNCHHLPGTALCFTNDTKTLVSASMDKSYVLVPVDSSIEPEPSHSYFQGVTRLAAQVLTVVAIAHAVTLS